MYDEDFKEVDAELSKLQMLANAKVTFLVDKNGHLIASAGDSKNLDTTSLASLTAGNIAATGGMAKLLGEKEFSILFHEGERDHIHVSIIAQRLILVVVFDHRSSLGLVRLRVKKSGEILARIFAKILTRVDKVGTEKEARSPFAAITEDDIDKLFS
jgi:predicted regulator of Ras-like GTPase activity (Roadblock/LC7/MglB family)